MINEFNSALQMSDVQSAFLSFKNISNIRLIKCQKEVKAAESNRCVTLYERTGDRKTMHIIMKKQRTTIKLPSVVKQVKPRVLCLQYLCGSPTSSNKAQLNHAEHFKSDYKAFPMCSHIMCGQSLSGLCCDAPRCVFNWCSVCLD